MKLQIGGQYISLYKIYKKYLSTAGGPSWVNINPNYYHYYYQHYHLLTIHRFNSLKSPFNFLIYFYIYIQISLIPTTHYHKINLITYKTIDWYYTSTTLERIISLKRTLFILKIKLNQSSIISLKTNLEGGNLYLT